MIRQTQPTSRAAGFTLVELLVVIAILVLLVALLTSIASPLIRWNRSAVTKNIMRTTLLAVDQFSEENPLGGLYDGRRTKTFGSLPPYQLHGWNGSEFIDNSVPRYFCDPAGSREPPGPGGGKRNILQDRFGRDFLTMRSRFLSPSQDYVKLADDPDSRDGINHDDNRALYMYLRILAPQTINQIPPSAIKPLSNEQEYVVRLNPDREGRNGEELRVPVLGIHDGWGVPLDYYLHVRFRFSSLGVTPYKVDSRVPVLRSHGADEKAVAKGLDKPEWWIFSTTFPNPEAGGPYDPYATGGPRSDFRRDGVFRRFGPASGGWVRLVGRGEWNASTGVGLGYLP